MPPAMKRWSNILSNCACVAIDDRMRILTAMGCHCGDAIINLSNGNYRGMITFGGFVECENRIVGIISDIAISFIYYRLGIMYMLSYQQYFYIVL
jgi:hypothetical protein